VIVLHLQLDELKKIIRMMMVMIVVIMMIEMTMTIVHSPSCFVSLSQAVVAAHPHPAVSLLSTCIINSDDDDDSDDDSDDDDSDDDDRW